MFDINNAYGINKDDSTGAYDELMDALEAAKRDSALRESMLEPARWKRNNAELACALGKVLNACQRYTDSQTQHIMDAMMEASQRHALGKGLEPRSAAFLRETAVYVNSTLPNLETFVSRLDKV